jgi:hypothetical protein
MKTFIYFTAIATLLISCDNDVPSTLPKPENTPIEGVWKLISGTTIEKNDSTVTDYRQNKSFIKIINKTHFAFMGHDLNKGKGSNAFFSSGGGTYQFKNDTYTEHLEYCNEREWEGNDFLFTTKINKDTLVLQGIEKIDSIGVNRINIEKYVRINP